MGDELRQKLKDLDKDIQNKRDNITKLKAERSEAIEEDRKLREEKQGSLKGLFNQIKEHNEEIKDLMHEKKLTEDDLDKISREKKELENSLPLIAQVEEKDDEMKKVKERKKVLGRKIHDKIEEKNKLSAKIDEVKKQQADAKGEEGEKKEKPKKEDKPKHPLTVKIEKMKEDIDKLRDSKTKIKDEHEKAYQAWKDQNELESKIKWIKNKKGYLQRQKKQEEYEQAEKEKEEKARQEKEEYEKLYGKPRKYQQQIDVCDNLISFIDSLRPKGDGEVTAEDGSMDLVNVDKQIASGDWKKEKVHVLKKEEEDLGIQPGQGKKKGKGKKKQTQAAPEETKLALSMQTLSYFDSLKVSPPAFSKDLDSVLKVLEEKKAYFIKISNDLNDGKTVETEETKPEEETKQENSEKPEPKQKRAKVNLDDDEMFPAMG